MTISLKHNEETLHKAVAAFVRGGSAVDWLREISRWNVDVNKLSLYVLPASMHSPEPAGLFAIINCAVDEQMLSDGYGILAGKLYLPVHASVYPSCTAAELAGILMWDIQVFHPTIGLVGFEKEDEVLFDELFDCNEPVNMQWDFAHAGIPRRPGLTHINVLQPTPQELLDSLKKDIDTKPLEEIPGVEESKSSALQKLFDATKYGVYKALYSFTKGLFLIGNKLPVSGAFLNQQGDKDVKQPTTGLLEQLQNWLLENIEVLEKKRQDELQRLMNMFDENADEALQYAIPLDSQYFNRGNAKPSAWLRWRPALFNLRDLNGGSKVDSWDIGDRYFDLKTKYLASAQSLIEKKDFKKAAYVYAHLLGDYTSAANVLVQGEHYREAAVLYKNHLKNTKAAAECLEKGGLTMEAIDLYRALADTEKVGDLYRDINQLESSAKYYELTVSDYLNVNNHLDAARVLHDKMNGSGRAKQVLLDGWNNDHQAENCLKRYFDVVAKDDQDDVGIQVEKIYRQTEDKNARLLNVLQYVRQNHAGEELANRTTAMAYEIVSKNAETNDTSLFHQLRHFVPGDYLLSPDVSRYVHTHSKGRKNDQKHLIKLNPKVRWQQAAMYRNQILVVGRIEDTIYFARCNWYADVEYKTWSDKNKESRSTQIICNPLETTCIIIKGSPGFQVPKCRLPKNKYFDDVIEVFNPVSLASHSGGLTLSANTITLLEINNSIPVLHHYNDKGELQKSITCKPAFGQHLLLTGGYYDQHIIKVGSAFYTKCGNYLLAIGEDGMYTAYRFNSGIRMLAAHSAYVLVSTNAGCHILRYKEGLFREWVEIFATEKIPSNLTFLSETRFALVQQNTVEIYSFHKGQVSSLRKMQSRSTIVSLLPSYTRQKFATVEETGRISVYDIENSSD